MKYCMRRWHVMTTMQFDAAFKVIDALQLAGYDAVVVGGAVRDTLLGVPVHDVDVATSATPKQTKTVFQKTVDIGIEHGTILVLDMGEPIEVTTFRTEGTYADHRRPDNVDFVTDLAEDLRRRDFTINAMALRSKTDIVDLFGGQDDLAAHIVRAVGVAEERFAEDALRMLRAVRFSAKLNFDVEQQTYTAMKKRAADLRFIAIERIKAEFDQIVRSGQPYRAFQLLVDTGLSTYLPGSFQTIEQWRGFKAQDSLTGWAFFSYLEQDVQLISRYRGSNKEQRFVKHVFQALQTLKTAPTPRELFDLDEVVWQAATMIANHVWQTNHTVEDILATKAALPIQQKNDLAVTGKEFLAWSGQKGGPWLKEALQQLLNGVLDGTILNDEQHIRGWFEREWKF